MKFKMRNEKETLIDRIGKKILGVTLAGASLFGGYYGYQQLRLQQKRNISEIYQIVGDNGSASLLYDLYSTDDIKNCYLEDEKGNKHFLKDEDEYQVRKDHIIGNISRHLPKGDYTLVIENIRGKKIKKDYFLDPAKGVRKKK